MGSTQPDETAGPSSLEDGASPPAFRKSIQWESDVRRDTEENQLSSTDFSETSRRQSLPGTSGYVSQLLEEYLVPDSRRKEDAKPIRKQSLTERRATIRAVEEDMKYYMNEATYPKSEESSKDTNLRKLSLALTRSPSKEAIKSETDKDGPISLQDVSRPSSEWKPFHVLEEERTDVQIQRSWLGTYIVGKDYWQEKDKNGEEKPQTVTFKIDEEQKPWYDMVIKKPSQIDSTFQSRKLKSKEKLEILKEALDEGYEEKRKKRLITAAHAREQPTTDTEEWSEEFKQCFEDVARMSKFSHRGTHIAMTDADKWLEKADILDHTELTVVHTGLFFSACGGSRDRGLSFDEFTQFLYMISHTLSTPLKIITRKLTACQRNPEDYVLKSK